MPKSRFGQGTVVDAKVAFSDPEDTTEPIDPVTGNTLMDPSIVVCRLRNPDTTIVTYIYGTDPEITRDSIGRYRFRFTLEDVGTYRWKWAPSAGPLAVTVFDECDSYVVANL